MTRRQSNNQWNCGIAAHPDAGCWCYIIVLNVRAPSEEKNDDSIDRFYEELEQVFYHFPKCHMKFH
jgi:hypothetical protein